MKNVVRFVYVFGAVACFAFIMIGAKLNTPDAIQQSDRLKKQCFGYTVIEAGKGIDCNGDTVKLVKSNGYYQLASRFEQQQNNTTAIN